MTIGTRIVELRGELKMSQSDLAKKAGVEPGTLSRYENDLIVSPRIPILLKIAAALNANPQYIIDGTEPKSIHALSANVNELTNIGKQLSPEALAMIVAAAKSLL